MQKKEADEETAATERKAKSGRAARAEIVLKLVEGRFGHVGPSRVEDALDMDPERLERLEERLPAAEDLEDLFG